jgi:hypothetical protein
MKNKIQQLIRVGLSKELLKNLSEGQISQLHRRMISEQTASTTMVPKADTNKINQLKSQKQTFQVYEKEIDEDENLGTDYQSGYNPDEFGGNLPVDYNNPEDDSEPDVMGKNDGMPTEGEVGEGKKKKSKYNPWAICTSSVGREDNDKFERCVKDVKRNVREGKNPHQVIVEMALEKMVEKHISPRMTKGDLIKTLSEQGIIRRPMSNMRIGFVDEGMDKPTKKSYSSKKEDMEQQTKEAPTRVKPGTKEKEKPGKMDPFKNPKHQPKPKAKKDIEEQATKTAPPVVKPGTKEKPKTSDPFKNPKHQPKPKASTKAPKMGTVEIPDYLTFDQLKINFKDQ